MADPLEEMHRMTRPEHPMWRDAARLLGETIDQVLMQRRLDDPYCAQLFLTRLRSLEREYYGRSFDRPTVGVGVLRKPDG